MLLSYYSFKFFYTFLIKKEIDLSFLSLNKFYNIIKLVLNNYIIGIVTKKFNKLICYICFENLKFIILFLKTNFLFSKQMLLDITISDNICNKNRYEITYLLVNPFTNIRIYLKFCIKSFQRVDSIVKLFSSADWLERELWDMFGIFFSKHPDLRRILTDYGFFGNPLKKNYPVTGFVELYYDLILKTIVVIPVELSQNMRNFQNTKSWLYNKLK